MNNMPFGIQNFRQWYDERFANKDPNVITWGPTPIPLSKGDTGIYDHGFVTDCMPVFTGLSGNEFCIISRTYASDAQIDNPAPGIKHLRFPDLMGPEDHGQVIVSYITGPGSGVDNFLSFCGNVRAKELSYLLPLHMIDAGYQVVCKVLRNSFLDTKLLCVKCDEPGTAT